MNDDERDKQMAIVAYIVGSLDMVLFFFALFLLVRILRHERKSSEEETQASSPEQPRSPHSITKKKNLKVERKFFHAIIMLAMLIRGTFLLTHDYYVQHIPYPPLLLNIYSQLAAYFFITAYLCLLLYWQDFYYMVNGSETTEIFQHLLRVFTFTSIFVIILVMATFGVTYFILDSTHHSNNLLDNYNDIIACIIASVVSLFGFMIAMGFCYYGVKIYLVFRRSRVLQGRKKYKAIKIVLVAVGCTICFFARAWLDGFTVYATAAAIGEEGDSVQWSGPPMLLFAFYFCLETLPGSLMLWLLRKVPKNDERKPLIQ